MNGMQLREVTTDTSTVSYTLIRKNVRNINLRVKTDCSVVVSADSAVPETYIDDFVRSKIPFILNAFDKIKQEENQAVAPLRFVTGEQALLLGRRLRLRVEPVQRQLVPGFISQWQEGRITYFSRNKNGEAVFCLEECLYMYTKEPEDELHKRQLYESWQKIQAKLVCGQSGRRFYPVFQKLGVAWPVIKIRKMRSRWGSCIPGKQKVTFNSQLVEKPLESIEYVVVHEFAHFIHPDHSRAFYGLVEQILPDWKERKELLRY